MSDGFGPSWRQRLRATTALHAVAAAVLLAAPLPAAAQLSPNARPTGGQVVAGQAGIAQSTTTTVVTQSSQRAAVNWQSFDVGSGQSVQFQQPSASASTLNRVVGPNPSEIAGKIQANGQIVVVNQAGLIFDKGAQVNAAGLVVSAAGISTGNFMAGRMIFDQAAKAGARIDNQGTLSVGQHGLAALVAPQVRNAGVIRAPLGTVILAGAEAETLDLYGDGLVSINVTKQVTHAPDGNKALVTNTGVVSAAGGSVVLTADAVDGVVQTLVNAGGHISANSTQGRTGRVLISGSGGDVSVEGTVSAQGVLPGTAGGDVRVSGSRATVVGPQARIGVSGAAGGGVVALGTTLARAKDGGTDAAAATSRAVRVAKGAAIGADATKAGNGGRVTLLSKKTTTMNGAITATGGSQGGNGGFVEISGQQSVGIDGTVDTLAPLGQTGLLTIDPATLIIGGSTTSPGTPIPQPPTGAQSISAATFNAFQSDVSLSATGTISLIGPTVLGTTKPGLSVTLTAGTTLTVGETLDQPGAVTLSGSTIALDAPVSVGGYTLTLNGGAISQMSGATITAGLLTGTGSTVNLAGATGGNAVTTLGPFTATAGFSFADNVGKLTTGTVNGGSSVSITNTGSLAIAAPITATGLVTLDANGIYQNNIGVITAGTLTGDAGNGAAHIGIATNDVTNLGTFSAALGFGLRDSVANLKVKGEVDSTIGIWIVNSGGALTVNAPLTTAGIVDLNAIGITQSKTGIITADTLIGDANGGAAHIGIATNDITNLGAFTAPMAFGLRDSVPTLTVTGAVDGGIGVYIVNTGGALAIDAPITSTNVVALTISGGITESGTGSITTPTLTGTAGGKVALGGDNDVDSLGAFSASGYGFILQDPNAALLTVNGPLDAARVSLTAPAIDIPAANAIDGTTSVALNATAGNITEDGTGGITTTLLTGSATGSATLDGGNAIADLGAFTANTGFTLNDSATPLKVIGAVDGGSDVTLTNTGALVLDAGVTGTDTVSLTAKGISQKAGGVVTAGTLTGDTGAHAADFGTATNVVADLGPFSAKGGFTLNDDTANLTVIGEIKGGPSVSLTNTGGSLTIDAPIDPTNSVTLIADGITQSMAGVITAGTLTGDAEGGAAHIGIATNDITNLGSFTATMAFGLRDSVPKLTVTGAVDGGIGVYIVNTGGALAIDAPITSTNVVALTISGGIAEGAGGSITTPTLTGTAGGKVTLGGDNDVGSLGAFSATGYGFILQDPNAALLTVNGPLDAARVSLTAPAIDIPTANAIDGTTSVALNATAGDITEDGTGSITTPLLTGGATGSATLDGGNAITDLGAFTANTGFTLNDSAAPLTVTGAVDGGSDVTLINTGKLVIAAAVSGTDTVSLTAKGISQHDDGVVTAGTLTGNTGAYAADFGNATNVVTNLGPFTAKGGFTLNDDTSGLTVIGEIKGGPFVSLTNTGGSLIIDAPIDPTNTVTLIADGISQDSAGIVTAGTLTGNAGAGAAELGTALNRVTNLGFFFAGQHFTLNDKAATLTVTGAVNGGVDVTLKNTGALVLDAGVTGTGKVSLKAAGISQDADGVVTAGTLTGNTGNDAADFGTAANMVTRLGPFTAEGDFTLTNDTKALTVVGALDGGLLVSLTNEGRIAIDAGVTGTDKVALTAAAITQNGNGVITTDKLTGRAKKGAADLGAATNDVTHLSTFDAVTGFTLNDGVASLIVTGPVDGGTEVTLTNTGNLAIKAALMATDTVSLTADGIMQNAAGIISAGTLTGSAGDGSAHLGKATNLVTNLGAFTASTGFKLNDSAAPLTVIGAVDGGSSVTLSNSGDVAIDAGVTATGAVFLTATGLSENADGVITAGKLVGSATTGAADLSASNAVAHLGKFTAIDGFTLADGTAKLTVTGAVDGGTDVTLSNSGSLVIKAPLTATDTVSLTADGIKQDSAGIITADTLSGSAGGGFAHLGQAANLVSNLGAFTATTGFKLNDATAPLTVTGPVDGGTDVTLTDTGKLVIDAAVSGTGTVSLTARSISQDAEGIVTAGTLIGTTGNHAADFGTADNAVTDLGPFVAKGGFTLNDDTPALTVVGAIHGGPFVTLINTGALAIDAPIDPTNTVTLIANGIAQDSAGVITAGTLTGSAGSGAADLGEAVNLVTNLSTFTATTGFTLNDSAAPRLTVIGAVDGGTGVALTNTDALVIDAAVTATGTVAFNAESISQSTAGVITAGTLTGSAGAGEAAFGSATNAITDLGPFTAGTGFTLTNGTPALIVVGAVDGGPFVALTNTGSLAFDAGVTATDTVSLTANGITQDAAGVITADTLSGTAGTGSAELAGANNRVARLSGFKADRAFDFRDDRTLQVVGNITAGTDAAITVVGTGHDLQTAQDVTVRSGAAGTAALMVKNGKLINDGTVRGGALASLTAATDIDQNGLVTADAVTETAGGNLDHNGTTTATTGNATLTAAGNLTQAGNVTAGGDAVLTATDGTLTQNGAVTAGGNAFLTAMAGTLDQNGDVTAGHSATLVAGSDLVQAGTVLAKTGDASLTAGDNLTQLRTVTAGGNAFLTATNGVLDQAGAVTAGVSATLAAGGDMQVTGPVMATTGNASLTAGGNITQSSSVDAGGNVSLTAKDSLTQNGSIDAGGNATLIATTGTLDQFGHVTAGNAAMLTAGADLLQTGTVNGATDTLIAAGNLMQSGSVNATGDVMLTATNGTLTQNATVTADGNATLTATNGNLDQFGSVIAGGGVNLAAGTDLFQTGGVHANGGDADLTAGRNLTQSSIVTASADVRLTALAGNLTQTGGVTAGTSAIIDAVLGNITDSGIVTAPNIQLAAPDGMVAFSGSFAGVVPDPTLNPHLKLAPGAFPTNTAIGAWISASTIVIAPSAVVTGAGGGQSQLVIALTSPNGSVSLGDFENPKTQLYLNLGTGFASGQIAVDALQVAYTPPGTTLTIDLSGTVNGQSGSTAAFSSFIRPLQKQNYQLNGCPIESTSCIHITTLSLPTINPLKDLEVETPQQADDILVILPDVGERDY